jgi:hypothetical protein
MLALWLFKARQPALTFIQVGDKGTDELRDSTSPNDRLCNACARAWLRLILSAFEHNEWKRRGRGTSPQIAVTG